MVRTFFWLSILIADFVLVSFESISQNFTNLVPNSSFENVQIIPDSCIYSQTYGGDPTTYFELFNYWASRAYPWRVPQKKHWFCGAPGTSDVMCTGGHTGNQFAQAVAGDESEMFTVELLENLKTTNKYYVEFWSSGSNPNPHGGMEFFVEHPKWCSGEVTGIRGKAVGINHNQWDLVENGWRRIFEIINPVHNFGFINFGQFHKKHRGTCVIDDVTIIDLGEDCPEENLFENCTFPTLNSFRFQASQRLAAGYDVNPSSANGLAIVPNGANVTFTAGEVIELKDGFSVEAGATFAAFIAPCDCPPVEFSPKKFYNLCTLGQQISLGVNAQQGKTYTWSATPPEALNFLSDPSSSNPIFTSPSNFNGNITYSVFIDGTVNGLCHGITGSYSIDIFYLSDPPASNSTITINSINYADNQILIDASTETTTQFVKVEVLKGVEVIKTYLLENGTDFSDGEIYLELPDIFTQCYDYTVRLSGQNLCFNSFGITVSQELDLDNSVPISLFNVFNTVSKDGNDDNDFGIDYSNAETYDLSIFTPSGVPIYALSNGQLPTQIPAILWNGQSNSGVLQHDGTYFYVLTLKSSCGESIEDEGFIEIFSSSGKQDETFLQPYTQSVTLSYTLHPNPHREQFTLSQTEEGYIKSYRIMDVMGRVMLSATFGIGKETSINTSNLAKGIYILHLETTQGLKAERIVKE